MSIQWAKPGSAAQVYPLNPGLLYNGTQTICLRIQHPSPESRPRQCWNMPTYSAPGPGVRTQTILKYAYVFSTRARSPDPDNVEICLRIQHPGPESRPRQCWNMPTYSAPGPGVPTQIMLKYAYVFSTCARSPVPDNLEICLRIQHLGPESGLRQSWNMPTYSAHGPGVWIQTMLKYAYVFSTRARSPDPDNDEICLRIQHPGLESELGQYWNMPTYPAPGPGVRTRTILKYAYVSSTRARSPDSDNIEICCAQKRIKKSEFVWPGMCYWRQS